MKIGICHYRIDKTDGVSLEIAKRYHALKQMGHEVKTIAGTNSSSADYTVKELEYDTRSNRLIKANAFYAMQDFSRPDEIITLINKLATTITSQLRQINAKEKFDLIFVHNILSHIFNLPATKAFYEFIKHSSSRFIGVHHDFYWDERNAQQYLPTNDLIKHFVAKYLPPRLDNLDHVVINTINQAKLKTNKGIKATVLPDTFDFSQPAWTEDKYNQSFLHDINVNEDDLVILHATRVVERKAIELAIAFVAELEKHKSSLIGIPLYNGKVLGPNSRLVLVLAGYTENFALPYKQKIKDEIKRQNIEARFIDHCVDFKRSYLDGYKKYSLWDTYVYADLVTYTSLWEGWGNQFIEAVFARKPLVVYEYPVFESDIKPEGYHVITLGNVLGEDLPNRLVTVPSNHMSGAAYQACYQLTDPSLRDKLAENWLIGQRYHGQAVLKDALAQLLLVH